MDGLTLLAVVCVGAYLAGSVNVSIVALRLGGYGDPRQRRSKNPGATNVYRVAGPAWAALVLALDLGRAAAVALVARALLPPDLALWTAPALLAGNRWPLFHRLRGGKGVANLLGYSLTVAPLSALVGGVVWMALFLPTRVSAVGSLAMVTVLCVALALTAGSPPLHAVSPALAAWLLVVEAHRPNIRRLVRQGNRGQSTKTR